jgi:hypothetical protein
MRSALFGRRSRGMTWIAPVRLILFPLMLEYNVSSPVFLPADRSCLGALRPLFAQRSLLQTVCGHAKLHEVTLGR